jgi:thiol:disulfide interchange protein
LGLNLTPCVLPLIPINLAILGAGAASANRRRGFLLGSVYGAGMALTYGVLGLTVVVTGAKFGTLNSSPWFNFGIALIFIVLSLAMFDKWALDFSGLQSRLGNPGRTRPGGVVAALVMGSVAATLAGACVAPVLISVLLLSTSLYTEGKWLGVLLPFILGLGMALPWPLAGGGLSFLPKPGNWMVRVKQCFGALILVFAGYYAVLGWSLLPSSAGGELGSAGSAQQSIDHFRQELARAKQSSQPILIKFGASWCKNCTAMERTTLIDPRVTETLQRFSVVKFAADHPSDPAIRQVLDQFGVMGLPTFLILSNQKPAVRSARIEPEGSRRF